MDKQIKDSNNFNSTNFIVFLWQKRKILIGLTLAAAILSAIFSGPFFITPKFKSTVVLFPTSTNSISKALLGDNQGYKQDLLQFGEEEHAEQLLQILNSSKIRDRIIQKYDLMKHYDIDKDSKYKRTLLNKEYKSNIKYRRTENMAVEITVLDADPDTAALIANDIAALLDSLKINMQKERAYRGYEIVKQEYENLKNDIQMKEDSLTKLREKGVHDYETQAEMINRQLAIEIAKNPKSSAVKALDDKLEVLAKYGGPYVSLRDGLEYEKKLLVEVKEKYDKAKIDAEEELPQTFKVDMAYPAEKKSYPVRWLIVLVASVSTLLLTIFVLILIDSLKDVQFNKNKQ
jgi:uncharacterized protein involved in exopolysaccharide biosynthesis